MTLKLLKLESRLEPTNQSYYQSESSLARRTVEAVSYKSSKTFSVILRAVLQLTAVRNGIEDNRVCWKKVSQVSSTQLHGFHALSFRSDKPTRVIWPSCRITYNSRNSTMMTSEYSQPVGSSDRLQLWLQWATLAADGALFLAIVWRLE